MEEFKITTHTETRESMKKGIQGLEKVRRMHRHGSSGHNAISAVIADHKRRVKLV